MRLDSLSHSELESAADRIAKDFSDSVLTTSPYNSDDILVENKIIYGFIGGIMFIIIWLGLLNIINEWLGATKQTAYVYMCCGLSQKKMICIVIIEILLMFTIGEMMVTCPPKIEPVAKLVKA